MADELGDVVLSADDELPSEMHGVGLVLELDLYLVSLFALVIERVDAIASASS